MTLTSDGCEVTVGTDRRATVVEADVPEQAWASVTVTTYVPADALLAPETVGFCALDENPSGPVHANV